MQNILILPTFDRPEMLWLCLDHLAKSPEIHEVQIRVYADAHVGQVTPKAEIIEVAKKFPQLDLQVFSRSPHQFHGNSFNVLMAYKEAYESDARYVFMVEDDVMIHPEFFAWHRQQHVQPLFCSIAGPNPTKGPYTSLGVCFERDRLKMVLPHCRAEYFGNMRGYCKFHFPPTKYDCEQDGLFCRLLRISQRPVVWATPPLADHVGWYGYHRKKSPRPTGTLEERYRHIKLVLRSQTTLDAMSKDFKDVTALRFCT